MDNAIYGSAKAWVNFNGVTTVTIHASYNVSSVTRNNTGDYTINFTNAFSDVNYAVSSIGSNTTGSYNGTTSLYQTTIGANPMTTTSVRIRTTGNGNVSSSEDAYFACIACFR